MWVLLYGEDTFRLFKYLKKIIKEQNIEKVWKIEEGFSELKEKLSLSSNLDLLGSSFAFVAIDIFSKAKFNANCLKFFLNLPKRGNLFLVERREIPLKFLEKINFKFEIVKHFSLQDLKEVKLAIKELLEEKEFEKDEELIELLAQIFKRDLWKLFNELEKLSLKGFYALNQVKAYFSSFDPEVSIFEWLYLLFSERKKEALSLLRKSFLAQNKEALVFHMLKKEVMVLLKAKLLLAKKLSLKEIAKELSLPEFILKTKVLPLAQNTPETKLKEIYLKLLEIDKEVKLSLRNLSSALEFLVIHI